MQYKVYDNIRHNLSDVSFNSIDDAELLIDILVDFAIENNIEYEYIIVPQIEINIKL